MKKVIIVAFLFQLEAFGQGSYSLHLPYASIQSRPTTCAVGDEYVYDTGVTDWCTAIDTWTEIPTTGGGLPAGLITISLTACPTGFSEVFGMDGLTLVGTLAAHGDVGTTGGSDTITPVGTVSQPTFTGNSVNSSAVSAGTPVGTNGTVSFTPVGTNATSTVTPLGTNGTATAAAQSFTGTPASCVVNHVHLEQMNTSLTGATGNGFPALLDASTSGGPTALWVPTGNPTVGGAPTCTPAGTNGTSSVGAETFTGSSSTVAAQIFTGSAGTVSAQTFTGSALGTHLHATIATGTVSQPTFSGNSADNRSAFVKVIFCSKN